MRAAGDRGRQACARGEAGGGNQALIHATLFSTTPTEATIAGTEATLTLPGPFYQPGE